MEKPVAPSQEDCCDSGCNPCIFDIYEKQLKLYERYLSSEDDIVDFQQENGISQLEYTKFIVIKNIKLCDSHKLIIFKRETLSKKKVWWKPGDHFLFKYTTNELSCTRAYTPFIPKVEQDSTCDFCIIVKKYDEGLVSSYLYNLEDGSATLWRGPYGHYTIEPNQFSRIIMIAQGTGIAAFIGIIDQILNNEEDMTKITLFYCCQSVDNILFRDELYCYKSYWNFNYEVYLSTSVTTNNTIRYQEPIKFNKLSVQDLNTLKPCLGTEQFIICGSQNFNQYYDNYIRNEFSELQNIVLF